MDEEDDSSSSTSIYFSCRDSSDDMEVTPSYSSSPGSADDIQEFSDRDMNDITDATLSFSSSQESADDISAFSDPNLSHRDSSDDMEVTQSYSSSPGSADDIIEFSDRDMNDTTDATLSFSSSQESADDISVFSDPNLSHRDSSDGITDVTLSYSSGQESGDDIAEYFFRGDIFSTRLLWNNDHGNHSFCDLCSSSDCIHCLKKSFRLIMNLRPREYGWAIKARVIRKSTMRTWKKPDSQGKLFDVDLLDKSGEIRATAFNDTANKFFDLIEQNKIYIFRYFHLKLANKKFSTLKNKYEITLEKDTLIIPWNEHDESVPNLSYEFQNIMAILVALPGTILDFIGVAQSASNVVNLRSAKGEFKKREVVLVDASMCSVVLTLWGQEAEEFSAEAKPVVAVKNGKVTEFMGKKAVSAIKGTSLRLNPDIPEAHQLRSWFESLPKELTTELRSYVFKGNTTLGRIRTSKLGFFNCFAYIMHIEKTNCVYKGCPSPNCLKKVVDLNNGIYKCEKCKKEFKNFKNRLALRVNIGDFTGDLWTTMFNDTAEEFLGSKADDVAKWQREDGPRFLHVFQKHFFKPYQLKLRTKMETYNIASELKITTLSIEKPNYKERCEQLLSDFWVAELLNLDHFKKNKFY